MQRHRRQEPRVPNVGFKPLAFLKGANRARGIFSECPPSRVWVFRERIAFYPVGAQRKGTGTTAYAWFVWDKDAPSGTELGWFQPGYKRRYTQKPLLFI